MNLLQSIPAWVTGIATSIIALIGLVTLIVRHVRRIDKFDDRLKVVERSKIEELENRLATLENTVKLITTITKQHSSSEVQDIMDAMTNPVEIEQK